MRFQQLVFTSSAAALLVWGMALAQESPDGPPSAQQPTAREQVPSATPSTTENPSLSPSSTNAENGAQKEKHWSGSLVDISCMVKELSGPDSTSATTPEAGPAPETPHFTDPGSPPQSRTGGMVPSSTQGQQPSTYPGQNSQSPDMGQPNAAQMAKAARIDNAAKQCTPTASTQAFGLALGGGQVVKFDAEGNNKASEALKEVDLQAGKKIKVKVTGTMADNTTVKVASVEVKGKRSSSEQRATASSGQ